MPPNPRISGRFRAPDGGTVAPIARRGVAKWRLAAFVAIVLAAGTGAAIAQSGAGVVGTVPSVDSASGCAPATSLHYFGDRDFPPYEYADASGNPAGFNVDLARAVARELNVPLDITLLPWAEMRRALQRGEAQLFSYAYSPERADLYDFLAPTTTLRSSLLLRQGRGSYPDGASGVAGMTIAVEDGTLTQRALGALPPQEQPTIVATPDHRTSITMLVSGDVDAAGGAGATLRWLAADKGLADPVEIPMSARPYMLATRKGCRATLAAVTAAIDRFKQQGVLDEIADRSLPRYTPGPPWTWRELSAIAGFLLLIIAVVLGWNWTLRRTVQTRTLALSEALLEQTRLNALVRSNEDRMAFAMDVIGEGVWEWDLEAGRIQASTRWVGSFGYQAHEAPTTYEKWMDYIHPDDRDRVAAAAMAHFEGRAPRFEATYRIPRKGGDWVWVLDRGRIVARNQRGKPMKMVGTLKDITVQLAAERALHEAKEAAEATSNAKSAFLATVSHEIRTPLNAVIGTAALLDLTHLNDDQRQLVSLIKRGGDSLLALVDDVLDFTKIESGRVELDERPFDLTRAVRDSISLVEHAARQKALQLTVTIDPGVPVWFSGDDTRLRQILLNLLSNAVKFTSHGDVSVRVTVSDGEDGRIRVRIDVRDTGIGVPKERLDRLFQPFSQVDSSTTRRFGGTGLGLAISRRLAELLGGTIDVQTEPGTGSTFSLIVPLARADAPASVPETVASSAGTAKTLRILLAEDNRVNQLVQRRMLMQLGYSVDVVANGHEVLDAVRTTEYDLVFLDIQMPEMDGLEAARELRRRGFAKRLVALTADVTTETRDACVLAGIDEYLSKPVKLETLAAVTSRVESARPAALST